MKKIGVVLTLFLVLILSVGTSFADVGFYEKTSDIYTLDLSTYVGTKRVETNVSGFVPSEIYNIGDGKHIAFLPIGSSVKIYFTSDSFLTFTELVYTEPANIDIMNLYYSDIDDRFYFYNLNTSNYTAVGLSYFNVSDILDGGTVTKFDIPNTSGLRTLAYTQHYNTKKILEYGVFPVFVDGLNQMRFYDVDDFSYTTLTLQGNHSFYGFHEFNAFPVIYGVDQGSNRINFYNFDTKTFMNNLTFTESFSNAPFIYSSLSNTNIWVLPYNSSNSYDLYLNGSVVAKNVATSLGYTNLLSLSKDRSFRGEDYAYSFDFNSPYRVYRVNLNDRTRTGPFGTALNTNAYFGDYTTSSYVPPQVLEFLGFQVIQEGLGYKIVGYTQDLTIVDGVLTIPSMLGVLPVVSIDPNVFENLGITELNIPSNIDINLSAFGYNDITKITIGENVDINPQIGDTTTMGDNAGFVFKYNEGGKTSGIYEFNGAFWVNTTNGISLEDKIKLILSSEKALNRHVYKQLIGTKTVILTSEYPLNVWTANLPSVQGINSLVSQTVVPSVVALDTAFRSDASMVNALGGSAHSSNLIKVFVQNEDATDMTQLPNTSLFDLSSQFNFPSKSFGYVVQLPEGVGLDSVEVVEVDSVDQSGNIIGDALETDLEDLNSAYADYLKDNPFTEIAPFSDVTIPSMVEVGREFYNSVLPSISFLFGIFATIPYIGVMMSFVLPFLLLLFILKIVRG